MAKKGKIASPEELGFDFFGTTESRTKFGINDFISTGSYNLNRIISGSLFKGIAEKRVTALIGEEAVGKSLFALCVIREAQKKDYICVVFDTEGALTPEFAENSGIDLDKLIYKQISTIEQFRRDTLKLIQWKNEKFGSKKKMLVILDSYGGLTAQKFINDVDGGKDTMDMGIFAKIAKATFKMIGALMAPHNVTLIYTNHITTDSSGYVLKQVQTGGMAARYYPSTVVMLKKKMLKDGDDITGVHIKAQTTKSRIVPAYQSANIYLRWDSGLDPTAGLFDIAMDMGFFEQATKEKDGVIEEVKGWYRIPGQSKNQRKDDLKHTLSDPAVLEELDKKIQELGFKTIEPITEIGRIIEDDDTVEENDEQTAV